MDLGGESTPLTVVYNDATNGTISNGGILRELEYIAIYTGSGSDRVDLSAASYTSVILGAGDDTALGSLFSDYLQGGAGNDSLDGNSGRDRLEGEDGDDVLRGGDGDENQVAIGSPFGFTFLGGLYGGAGNDTLDGGSGNDYLEGGAGNDSLVGGEDNDYLVSDTNNLSGVGVGRGIETLIGGGGNDSALVDLGGESTPLTVVYNDATNGTISNGGILRELEYIAIYTGSGSDRVDLSAASYTSVILGAGDDTALGSLFSDYLQGGAGNDSLDGNSGRDRLEGEDGDDVLRGGDGDENQVAIGGPHSGLRSSAASTAAPATTRSMVGQVVTTWRVVPATIRWLAVRTMTTSSPTPITSPVSASAEASKPSSVAVATTPLWWIWAGRAPR